MDAKKQKIKEFEKISSDEGVGNIFKSYIHNFSGYKRISVALHHLQKAENLYNGEVRVRTYFKFERLENLGIMESIADIFDAHLIISDNKEVICEVFFGEEYKKTKTYIFQYSAEFYKGWLSDKLPMFISRARNEGMDRLRLIVLRQDTKDVLEKELNCKATGFYIVYNEAENFGVIVYSITYNF